MDLLFPGMGDSIGSPARPLLQSLRQDLEL